MKINKYTAVMAALGVLSLASVAQAANYVVYLTGSTAARQQVFNALTTAGDVFTVAGTVQFPAGETGGDNSFVVRGVIGADTIDFDCTFTGSEAGIASVGNSDLTQSLPNDPNGAGPYELPGLKANLPFYVPTVTAQGALPTYGGTTSALPNGVGNNQGNNLSFPDLAMADTSPVVSRTSASSVHDFGFFAVVPFTWMKGYQKTPDAAWTDLTNITLQEANVDWANGDIVNASTMTGVPADSSDGVAIVGRNFGSGTRVNADLNAAQTPTLAHVDQWTYSGVVGSSALTTLYPVAHPGTLTFSGTATAGQPLVDIGDDGYDSGKFVGQTLNVDGTGSGSVLLGYLGISDATKAGGTGVLTGGGAATFIKYDGVYESDTGVEQGTYPFWGYEHVIGRATASSAGATEAGSALVAGLPPAVAALGSAAGDVTTGAQSALIPLTKMVVSRAGGSDSGFPK